MEKIELEKKLTSIFRRVFNNATLELSGELTANDVEGWDSLSHMILIAEVENELSIRFKLKELNKMRNVHDMLSVIESKL